MRARPDGYTIIMGHMGTHAAAVTLYPHLPYNPAADFEPIGQAAGMPVLVLVRKESPAHDLAELVSSAAPDMPRLKMAHAGIGSVSYATCQLFNWIAGIKPNLAAFQGTGPAMDALIAGKVDYMCDQVVNVVPQAQAGSIRALAVGTLRRNEALPNVPTSREAGLPAFQASAWNALFAPKGTPKSVITVLNSALGKALENSYVRGRLLALGADIPDPEDRSPEALARLVESEIAKWKKMQLASPAG
jgi:tripartite-type tricarboxylate transporter receptor subunit TctC